MLSRIQSNHHVEIKASLTELLLLHLQQIEKNKMKCTKLPALNGYLYSPYVSVKCFISLTRMWFVSETLTRTLVRHDFC